MKRQSIIEEFPGNPTPLNRHGNHRGIHSMLPRLVILFLVLGISWGAAPAWSQQPPVLPQGMEEEGPKLPLGMEEEGPDLPQGMEEEGPDLPTGLDEGAPPSDTVDQNGMTPEEESMGRLGGFLELRGGRRLQEDPKLGPTTLAEFRAQLEADWQGGGIVLHLKVDLLFDSEVAHHDPELERGKGALDLREAYGAASPLSFLDVKLGRQVITWGTGDLLFINDLFPKDYPSFLLGRDDAYLKAPSDALKLSAYAPWVNLDLVVSPRFDPDRHVDGSRLSYWDPAQGKIDATPVVADQPHKAGEDGEWAARLHGVFGAVEAALYGYRGFWKSPAGIDPATGHATFPRLAVYGASLRAPLGIGLANIEAGTYRSLDDTEGNDPFIRNGETRLMVGYEMEALQNLTLGLQAYRERMRRYENYLETLPAGMPSAEQERRLYTLRLTWLTFNQNVVWSWFTFHAPRDKDTYNRAKVRYTPDDAWSMELGANLFGGRRDDGFFGQFRQNNNAYAALRYSF